MSDEKLQIYERALARERAARKEAERILEEKSRELFFKSTALEHANKQLEQLVKEKTSQLKGIFENIVDAYVVTNLFGDVLKMNEAAEFLLGFTLDDKVNLMTLVHPEDVEKVTSGFKELYSTGAITDFQIRINVANKTLYVELNASMVYDESQKPIAAQGIVRDVTHQKAAQQRLINSENRLSALISNLESAVLLEDEHRMIVITNSRFCEFFNIPLTPEQLIGQNCADAAAQSKHLFVDPDEFESRILTLTRNKKQVLADQLIMTDGCVLERDFIPIFENDDYKGHLWTYRDVTLNRRYRQNIEAEREKYRSIIANMELGLIEVNTDDEILMVNHSLEVMSGYTADELIGKKGKETLLDDTSAHILEKENEKRLSGNSNSYEVKARTKSGELRYWLISGAPNYDINGNIVGSIGIHLDITALKVLELQKEKLLQKLAKSNTELQEYAHVVSHDLKSPLRSLDALLSWVKEDSAAQLSQESLEHLSMMETTLEKMEQLISDVLNYSSVASEQNEATSVDLNVLITDIEKLVHLPSHINLKLIKKLPTIKADRPRLQQLFQNLISNAIRYCDKAEGVIEINWSQNDHKYTFSVSDNGIGIEKQYHDKIFKIFQSLNKTKDSTGIGLSIVKKIVEMYGGDIWLESTPGKGTTFYFTLSK